MKTRTRASIVDMLVLLRPDILICLWAVLALGYYKACQFLGTGLTYAEVGKLGLDVVTLPNSAFVHMLVTLSILVGALNVSNQLVDLEVDIINRKPLLIACGRVPLRLATGYMWALLLIGILLALCLRGAQLLTAVVTLALATSYSIPPLHLKGRPFLDVICNALGFGLVALVAGWLCVANFLSVQLLLIAIPYVLVNAAIFTQSSLADLEGDKAGGYLTTGLYLGTEKSIQLTGVFLGLAAIISILLLDMICLGISLVFLVALGWVYGHPIRSRIIRSYQVAGALASSWILARFPLLLILSLVTYLGWRSKYGALKITDERR